MKEVVSPHGVSSVSFPTGHIRDPNNQLHVVKNLRICVSSVTSGSSAPSATLSPAQGRVLGDVVSSCQLHEGALTSAITAGDYDLSVSGRKPPLSRAVSGFRPGSAGAPSRELQTTAAHEPSCRGRGAVALPG